MSASQNNAEARGDGLQEVLEVLCQIPREDMCRNLILAVAQVIDKNQAREFEQKTRAITRSSILSVGIWGRRWWTS